MQEYENRRGISGWIEKEEEPEETHWDKGTQTEDEVLDRCQEQLLPRHPAMASDCHRV
jgi:hypothetical protein